MTILQNSLRSPLTKAAYISTNTGDWTKWDLHADLRQIKAELDKMKEETQFRDEDVDVFEVAWGEGYD